MLLHLLHRLVHTTGLFDLFLLSVDFLRLSQICMDILKKNMLPLLTNKAVTKNKNKRHGFKSANELCQLNGRHLSANLLLTFARRGVSSGQRSGSPRLLI
jgi:hypothetical protein